MNRALLGFPDPTDLLLQLLQDNFPNGATVIDPTGQFAKAAANILPKHLTERAIYFDPTNQKHIVGLNVLEHVPKDSHQAITELICAYFDDMFPKGNSTLAFANATFILANSLRLLLNQEGETLLGVLKVISDTSFRNALLKKCTDPVVLKNWATLEEKKKEYALGFATLERNLGMLLMSPTIRNIVGQPKSSIEGDILIANLDRAKLGDLTAKLLGGLLIARSTGHIYIHNFGFFASGSDALVALFPQERLTISLRFLEELTPKVRQEVLSIEDLYVFKTNKKDADELAFHVGLMNPRVLTELEAHEYRTPEGLYKTERPPSLKRLKALKNRTRACHTRPRALVEKEIAAAIHS
jgi:hypothetical protein